MPAREYNINGHILTLTEEELYRYEVGLKCFKKAKERHEQAEEARHSLRKFTEWAWPIAEPSRAFIPNWHIDAISEHLQATTDGSIKRLLINIGPGYAKSLLVSVIFPAWRWVKNPEHRFMCSSYAEDLSLRDAKRSRTLIESPEYRSNFDINWTLKRDTNVASLFANTKSGFRFSHSVSGKGTGFRGSTQIIDDPLNAKEQMSDAALEEAIFWLDNIMSSRFDDQKNGIRIIIMQRLSERDISGHVLAQGGYTHLMLPSEFEPERKCITFCNGKQFFIDKRQKRGELLFPELFGTEVIAQAKKDMGELGYAGQHQQRPTPASGGMLKKHWWNYWQPAGAKMKPVTVQLPNGEFEHRPAIELPKRFDQTLQSWDMAFKANEDSDFVAGLVVAALGADRFVLAAEHGRFDLPETLNAVRRLSYAHPNATIKLVEDKANGPAVIQSLRHELGGFIEVNPEGGKISRVNAASPQLEAGNWYLPHPDLADWIGDPASSSPKGFIGECAAFPKGINDDYCLAAGTMVATTSGDKPIEDVVAGDSVLTPLGPRTVVWAGQTGVAETIMREGVRGTPPHEFFVHRDGFCRMDSLTQGAKCDKLSLCGLIRWQCLRLLNSMELCTDSWAVREDIVSASRVPMKDGSARKAFMLRCGSLLMDGQFLQALTFITKITILSIITLTTWSLYRASNTLRTIHTLLNAWINKSSIWNRLGHCLLHGTARKMVSHGIGSTARTYSQISRAWKGLASGVAKSLWLPAQPSFAGDPVADIIIEDRLGAMMLKGNASSAGKSSTPSFSQIHPKQEKHAALNVKENCALEPVFNLRVDGAGVFYANGILVHNCDSWSMAAKRLLHFTGPKPKPQYIREAPSRAVGSDRGWMIR